MIKKILYFDMDCVLVDYSQGIAKLFPETFKEYEAPLYAAPGVFSRLKSLEGTLDAFETFSRTSERLHSFNASMG
jgi:hypothetical protein